MANHQRYQRIKYDLHCVIPTKKIYLDLKFRAFSLRNTMYMYLACIVLVRMGIICITKRPIRSIRYYLFIKCYLMHSLSTPFVQTNSALPDRSIIIHSIIIYFTATNTFPFISLLKLVFSRFTIFSLDYDGLIDMMS